MRNKIALHAQFSLKMMVVPPFSCQIKGSILSSVLHRPHPQHTIESHTPCCFPLINQLRCRLNSADQPCRRPCCSAHAQFSMPQSDAACSGRLSITCSACAQARSWAIACNSTTEDRPCVPRRCDMCAGCAVCPSLYMQGPISYFAVQEGDFVTETSTSQPASGGETSR